MLANTKQQQGRSAEEYALTYLKQQGLTFIAQNFRCKLGEIDLIMRDIKTIVFVEVRYRRNANLVRCIESVDTFKQAKIIKTALFYLQKNNLFEKMASRFDVVAVTTKIDPQQFEVEWIKNAFQTRY